MAEELSGIFPRTWIPGAIPPPAIVLIYLDWLLQELDMRAEEKWPILKTMRGHRRKEIIAYLESLSDWTDGVLNTVMY